MSIIPRPIQKLSLTEIVIVIAVIVIISLVFGSIKQSIIESAIEEYLADNSEEMYNSAYGEGYDEGHRDGFREGQNLQGIDNRCSRCNRLFTATEEIPYRFCYECWKKNMGECAFCHSETPLWNSKYDFTVCGNCLGEAADTSKLNDFLINYNESR